MWLLRRWKLQRVSLRACNGALDSSRVQTHPQVLKATEGRDRAQADLDMASAAVEAAARELAGAEAGDGRDESNRSTQERLADAQRAQVSWRSQQEQSEAQCQCEAALSYPLWSYSTESLIGTAMQSSSNTSKPRQMTQPAWCLKAQMPPWRNSLKCRVPRRNLPFQS